MNVLIVDDHELFSEGLKMVLDAMNRGLAVRFVAGCAQAIALEDKDVIQLILLDYNLTDAVGVTAIDVIKKNFPLASIVVISSEDSSSVIQNSIAHGASGFIPKSSSRKILIAALELVLNGGIYLPPQAFNIFGPNVNQNKLKPEQTLTSRQYEILMLAVRGASNKVIAASLDIAEGTVKAHLFAAYKAIGVNSRIQAVLAFADDQKL